MPSVHTQKPEIRQNARQHPIRDSMFVAPHQELFAGKFSQANGSYYVWYDEAQRDSLQNTLAMRNDGFIEELLRHRQTPVVCLPFHVVVEDPDDPRQVSIGDALTKIIKRIPRFRYLLMSLLDAIFYGRAAVELRWGTGRAAGNVWNLPVDHFPIAGDKLRYLRDGTPGIAIRTGSEQDFNEHENAFLNAYADCIQFTMLGEALFLKQPFLRDRFLIHSHNPSDTDYLFELESQASIFGLGLRSRLYWLWNLRTELLSWMVNALQRVGANGMIFGFYEEGNDTLKDAVLNSLRQLVQDNYAAFPVRGGMSGATNSKGVIDRIEPAAVGYDVLMQLIEWCEGIMRRAFLGQDLSSKAEPTGIGAGAAQLQGNVRADFIDFDSGLLGDTVSYQLLPSLLKYNRWIYDGREVYGDELPFSCRLEFQLARENVQEAIQAAQMLYEMGVELDADDLRRKAGLAPPKRKETTVVNPEVQGQHQENKSRPAAERTANRLDGMTRDMMRRVKQRMNGGSDGGSSGSGVARMPSMGGKLAANGHARRRREFSGAR
jgi:hypothetical protein